MEENNRQNIRRYYNFHTFAEPGCPIQPTGPFRDNIRSFLEECGVAEEYELEGMPVWRTLLVHGTDRTHVPLYTIEEDVKKIHAKESAKPFCHHCRCAGWSKNIMSKRRYHFIIPADDSWTLNLKDGVFQSNTHCLHGLIHCNGFGHLICINGIKEESKNLCGIDIMDLWDRLCANLLARKITVQDLTNKHMMELRLIHGIAYGHPWFGRWGYRFCNGSFGTTELIYDLSLEATSSTKLDKIITDYRFDNTREKIIKQIIEYYRTLSETNLLTLRDLFEFILSLESGKFQNFTTVATNMATNLKKPNRKVSKLEETASVLAKALKEKRAAKGKGDRSSVMSRKDARLAVVGGGIGDTGLVDFVFKSMDNVIVGDSIIRKVLNRNTNLLEFSIHEVKNGSQVDLEPGSFNNEAGSSINPVDAPPISEPTKDAYQDLFYLSRLLVQYPESDMMNQVRSILNSKNFSKEFPFRYPRDDMLRYKCQLMPIGVVSEPDYLRLYSIAEYVVLPRDATVGDLKEKVQCGFRDTYCTMEDITIIEIADMEDLADSEPLLGKIESGSELSVRGQGLDLDTRFNHEGGPKNRIVKCKCGAQDDDGEVMLTCSNCDIMEHKMCNNCENSSKRELFMCDSCFNLLRP